MLRFSLIAVLVLLVAAGASPPAPAAAAVFVVQTNMYGDQEVPPVQTTAWGFVRFFFEEDRTQVTYTVDVKGYSGSLVTGADIHRGLSGTNGPVVHHLADGGFIVTSGRLRLTQDELKEMAAGLWYASLKTSLHPQGELRGQIILPSGFFPEPQPSAPAPASAPVDSTAVPAPARESPSTGLRISPPSTGDGGLADTSSAGLWPAATAVLFATVVSTVLALVRIRSEGSGL